VVERKFYQLLIWYIGVFLIRIFMYQWREGEEMCGWYIIMYNFVTLSYALLMSGIKGINPCICTVVKLIGGIDVVIFVQSYP